MLIHAEALRVQALRLQHLGKPLFRVNAEGRITHQRAHLGNRLVLQVALHQGGRTPCVNLEISLGLVVLAVQHQVLVVAANVRLRHAVIEQARNPAQHRARVVLEHLHPAYSVRRMRGLALEHGGHASDILGHLQSKLHHPLQLSLAGGNIEHLKGGANIGHIRIVVRVPNLARRQRPLAIRWRDRSPAQHNLRARGQTTVVHHVAHRRGQDALGHIHLHTHTAPPWGASNALPHHHVIGELAGVQRVDRALDDSAVHHGHNHRCADIAVFWNVHASRLKVFPLSGHIAIPDVENVIRFG